MIPTGGCPGIGPTSLIVELLEHLANNLPDALQRFDVVLGPVVVLHQLLDIQP